MHYVKLTHIGRYLVLYDDNRYLRLRFGLDSRREHMNRRQRRHLERAFLQAIDYGVLHRRDAFWHFTDRVQMFHFSMREASATNEGKAPVANEGSSLATLLRAATTN